MTTSLRRNGVRLVYDRAGTGPPVLLVHGLGCTRALMRPLFDHLASGHDVVSVDLRGHGESDAAAGYESSGFVDDLVWVAAELGLDRPVAIGHSYGGMLAVELAGRGVLSAVVALDTIFFPQEMALDPDMAPLLERVLAGDADAMRQWNRSIHIGPDDDPRTAIEVLAVMAAQAPEITAAVGPDVLAWDGAAALAAAPVPVLVVAAEAGSPQDPSRLTPLLPHLTTASVIGSGHFVQLMATAQVTAMIDRFLELVSATARQPADAARA